MTTPTDLSDYSPSATITPFDCPVPLLRGPVPAGPSDDPSAGPFVLAFRDSRAWRSAFKACESKIIEQCEAGARIGCAVSASSKCGPPWWWALIGRSPPSLAEREECEEREMAACVAASKEKCVKFAKDKCLGPFRDARIAVNGRDLTRKKKREAVELIFWASMGGRRNSIGLENLGSWVLSKCKLGETNYRGSDLLDTQNV